MEYITDREPKQSKAVGFGDVQRLWGALGKDRKGSSTVLLMVFRYAVDVSTDSNSPIYAGAVMSCWRGVCRVCRGRVVLGSDFDIRTDSVVQLWIPWFGIISYYFYILGQKQDETQVNLSSETSYWHLLAI